MVVGFDSGTQFMTGSGPWLVVSRHPGCGVLAHSPSSDLRIKNHSHQFLEAVPTRALGLGCVNQHQPIMVVGCTRRVFCGDLNPFDYERLHAPSTFFSTSAVAPSSATRNFECGPTRKNF